MSAPAPNNGRSLVWTTAALALVSIVGRLVVFARDLTLTHRFGATASTDAFFLVYNLWVRQGVSLQAAMPKIMLQRWQIVEAQGREAAGRLLWSGVLTSLVIGAVVAAVLAPLSTPLLRFFEPDLDARTFDQALAVFWTTLPLLGIGLGAGVFTVAGQARGHFLVMEGASFLLSFGVVFGLLAFADSLGIVSGGVGLLLGGLAMLLVLSGWAMRERFPFALGLAEAKLSALSFGQAFLATTFGYSGGAALGVIQRWFYARLPEGELSYLEIAWRVGMLPQHLLLASVMTAFLPTLTAATLGGDKNEEHRLILRAATAILAFSIPGAALTAVVAEPLISATFLHGKFSQVDSQATAHLLSWLGVPGVLMTFRGVVVNLFFAYGKFRLAMILGSLDLLVFPIAATFLGRFNGLGMLMAQATTDFVGLCLALPASALAFGTPWRSLVGTMARLSLATTLATATAWACVRALPSAPEEWRRAGDLAAFGVGTVSFTAVFVPSAAWLGIDDVVTTLRTVQRRLAARLERASP